MKCPYCQKDMDAGYIQCRDGVAWTPKKYLVAAFSSFGKNSLSLSNDISGDTNAVHAYKCGDCKKVIIDYAE
jgi:hypothetical protein